EDLVPGPALARLVREHAVNNVTLTPSALATMQPEDYPGLATIFCAGEACPGDLAARWSPGRAFYNAYGPTETTVCATVSRVESKNAQIESENARPPIGFPLPYARTYVLRADMERAPVGEHGE